VEGSCEHSNEPLGSIKEGLSSMNLIKRKSTLTLAIPLPENSGHDFIVLF
jgi:hypothetical protein